MFGSFSFGNLIKTFLPGFVWLCVFAVLEVSIFGTASWVLSELESANKSIFILAIPLSILAGLISNIFMFSWALDKFVREPVKKKEEEKWKLYNKLSGQLKSECCKNIDCRDDKRQSFLEMVDAEIILLNKVGVEKVAYVREQYWYYLEFCLNLFASLVGMLVVMVGVIFTKVDISNSPETWGMVVTIIFLIAVSILVFKAARKNYERHLGKMISLMAANLMDADERDSDKQSAAGNGQKFLVQEID